MQRIPRVSTNLASCSMPQEKPRPRIKTRVIRRLRPRQPYLHQPHLWFIVSIGIFVIVICQHVFYDTVKLIID